MVTHIEQPFDGYLLDFSSQYIDVFIISTADYSFGLLVLISTVCKTNKPLKKWRIAFAHETNQKFVYFSLEIILVIIKCFFIWSCRHASSFLDSSVQSEVGKNSIKIARHNVGRCSLRLGKLRNEFCRLQLGSIY